MIAPDDSSKVNIGGDANVGDAVTPEVDLTYFITNNIAVEAIAATAQHQVDYTGNVNLGETWILPPTVTLQYHFTPENTFSPYVGAGINYSYFYGEKSGTGFRDLEIDGGFGTALQAGTDIWLNETWGLNFEPPPIKESRSGVIPDRVWATFRRLINGTEGFYGRADYRSSASG